MGKRSIPIRKAKSSEVDPNPFVFLKSYYAKLDQDAYREKCRELGIGFVDGFIGYIGYDLVKEFEPRLKPCMNVLEDTLGVPDLYFVRPKLVLAYSHKSSQLTMINNAESVVERF